MFSHESSEWITPEILYAKLSEEILFDLDPCTTKDNPLQTPLFYTKEDDGLYQKWIGNVFINPPYNKEITKWLQKAVNELKSKNVDTVVFLLPARTDTRWFHDYIWDSKHSLPRKGIEIRFLKGRLKFRGADNPAPFPSMIVIFSR